MQYTGSRVATISEGKDYEVGATQEQTLERSIFGGARNGAVVASDREVACGVRSSSEGVHSLGEKKLEMHSRQQ